MARINSPLEDHAPRRLLGTMTTSEEPPAEPLVLEVSSSRISSAVGISGRVAQSPAATEEPVSSKYCRIFSFSRCGRIQTSALSLSGRKADLERPNRSFKFSFILGRRRWHRGLKMRVLLNSVVVDATESKRQRWEGSLGLAFSRGKHAQT